MDANRRLGHRPMTMIAHADLADALVARGDHGDGHRAVRSWRDAAAIASEIGLADRAATWRDQAATHELEIDHADACELRKFGKRWELRAGSRRAVVPDLIGVRYLGTLLERPGLEIPAVELCGGTAVEAVAHDLLDRESLVAYRRQVAELDAEIERAEAVGDTTRISVLIDERDALRSELATVLAVSGRSRRFVDASERARTAVRKAITRALAAIAAADGTIASELRASISTGHTCSYRPGPDDPRRWTVSDS